MDAPDLALVRRELVPKEYDKCAIIYRQGDPGRELYIIARGKVRIFRSTSGGTETSINPFSRLDVFGEFSIVDCELRQSSAQAIEPCVLLTISGDKLREYVDRMPKLAHGLIRLLTSKARWTAAFAETIAQYGTGGRLLHLLLLYNEKFGAEQIPGKRYLIDLGLNLTELASLVGARREWVNHLLQLWSKRGLVEYASGQIFLISTPTSQLPQSCKQRPQTP